MNPAAESRLAEAAARYHHPKMEEDMGSRIRREREYLAGKASVPG